MRDTAPDRALRPDGREERPDLPRLVDDVRTFVAEHVLPLDDAFDGDITAAGGDALRVDLQQRARDAGVFGPHIAHRYGGHGLGMSDRAPLFEAAGRSLFGPLALNAAAPDEGNMHLLERVATPEQQASFLHPIAKGEARSAFAMTEPAPGAGADPSMLRTRAVRTAAGWRLDGRKTFITGADGCDVLIVMARTSGDPGSPGGATMFLVRAGTAGLEVGHHVPTMDRSMLGGHCEVTLSGVFVGDDAVLGTVDEGFKHAQARLGPARMTHVMRWLGAATRSHEIAVEHAHGREAFGTRIAELGMVQGMIADNEIDLAATRALMMEACRELDAGGRASGSTAIAKAFAGEALFRVADRAMQMCGGVGVTTLLPIARIHRELRPFRIYDGPSEVHRWAIARRAVRNVIGTSP